MQILHLPMTQDPNKTTAIPRPPQPPVSAGVPPAQKIATVPTAPPAAQATGQLRRARGYLPHYDRPRAVQSVTFRLADSLPASVLARLNARPNTPEAREQLESAMDAGHGYCRLAEPVAAAIVAKALPTLTASATGYRCGA